MAARRSKPAPASSSDQQAKIARLEQENAQLRHANAALNRDLAEALEQQTATSGVLQVISRSAFDLQSVLETLVENAVRLCGADFGQISRRDGETYYRAASYGTSPEIAALLESMPIGSQRQGCLAWRVAHGRRVVHIPDLLEDPEYPRLQFGRLFGHRTVLGLPLLRGDSPIGLIILGRMEPRPFTDKQIALVTTFADQAVIAIENVRLFQELETRNQELAESLEQQTATAEVLQVISRSAFDLQPVLDTLTENAVRLCAAEYGVINRFDGDFYQLAASCSLPAEWKEFLARTPVLKGRGSMNGRVAEDLAPVHIHDALADPEYQWHEAQKLVGNRTMLGVPMLREGVLIGIIVIWKTEVAPFTDKQIELVQTFADQAVIAIENVRLFQEVEARNRELAESLEQQTATAEVLQVISRSAFDLQPVLDTLIENAVRLSGADCGAIVRPDGDHYLLAAAVGMPPQWMDVFSRRPLHPGRGSLTGRVALERRPVQILDVMADPEYEGKNTTFGTRTMLGVPMLREGAPIGIVALERTRVEAFTEKQIELVTTFADQAVIAIENVRLFQEVEARNRELAESLEQQTATAEVLQVISRSAFDLEPVLQTLVENATRLCSAEFCQIFRLDGEVYRMAATYGTHPALTAYLESNPVRRIQPTHLPGRVAIERRVIHIPDIRESAEHQSPEYSEFGKRIGYRTALGVPLLREGVPIGVLTLGRMEARPFTDKQIELVQTFADQAVIAIENVRLFQEVEARNRDLEESLEQQTATAEVLQVISRSAFDLQPVLEMLIENSVRLCGADFGTTFRFDGEVYRRAASYGNTAAVDELRTSDTVRRPGVGWPIRRVLREGRVLHIPDVLADPEFDNEEFRRYQQQVGQRTVLGVPMLREGTPIGVMMLARSRVEPFTEKQIELVTTFADQAVIAIENVRLFQEVESRTHELARSVEELQALGAVSQAVNSTLDLQEVLTTVVRHAVQLSATDGGAIYEYDDASQLFEARATHGTSSELIEAIHAVRPRLGEGAVGLAAARREAIQFPDLAKAQAAAWGPRLAAGLASRVQGVGPRGSRSTPIAPGLDVLRQAGLRAALAVPLLREDQIVGVLVVRRKTPGEFPQATVDLVQTFANQSVLAIQNARLFQEIEDKSRQLAIASQHKSEFLANMSHELRTPLNAILGFSEVLLEQIFGEVNEKQQEYLEDILSSGRHLLSLINDILDLSKVEAGRMDLDLGTFALPEALANGVTMIKERASRHGIALSLDVSPAVGQITADERKVKQVVFNLLSNAVKFTPEGGRVELSAAVTDGAVQIAVRDSGVGIAPEDQDRIFEEFRQAGHGAAKTEGTGLGLALARKFVELHGGRLWVESQLGAGSTFTFTLPLGGCPQPLQED